MKEGVPRHIDDETSRLLREEKEFRESEEVDKLYRFTDAQELLSYFGRGKTIKERVETALDQPDVWEMFEFAKIDLDTKSKRQLTRLLGGKYADQVNELGRLGEDALADRVGGRLKNYRPIIVGPTDTGFSVNAAARNYSKPYQVKVFLLQKDVQTKDMPGRAKFVPFEPSYVSTPPIFVEEVSAKQDQGAFVLECYGRLLTQKEYEYLQSLIDPDMSPEECAESLKSKQGNNTTIFNIPTGRVIDYIYAEKIFKSEADRESYFDSFDKVW